MIIQQIERRVRVQGQPLIIRATLHQWHLVDCQDRWQGVEIETSVSMEQRGGHEGRPRRGTKRFAALETVSRAFDTVAKRVWPDEVAAVVAFEQSFAEVSCPAR